MTKQTVSSVLPIEERFYKIYAERRKHCEYSKDSRCVHDKLKHCAQISKSACGIGLSMHNIRARGTCIKGTRGISNGLIPMLRVFDVTYKLHNKYVNDGNYVKKMKARDLWNAIS